MDNKSPTPRNNKRVLAFLHYYDAACGLQRNRIATQAENGWTKLTTKRIILNGLSHRWQNSSRLLSPTMSNAGYDHTDPHIIWSETLSLLIWPGFIPDWIQFLNRTARINLTTVLWADRISDHSDNVSSTSFLFRSGPTWGIPRNNGWVQGAAAPQDVMTFLWRTGSRSYTNLIRSNYSD